MADRVRIKVVKLEGGLDIETPVQSLPPGTLRESLNYECSLSGGYGRIEGYERFDGQPSPAAAEYDAILLQTGHTASVGQAVEGTVSGATAVIVELDGNIARFTKAVGTFSVGEYLEVSGSPVGVVQSLSVPAQTLDGHATTLNLAADAYRNDIAAPPGEGSILGGAIFGGVVYAWRKDVAPATTMSIYKSTAAGWELVPLLYEIAFTTGSTEYAEGSTLSKGGITATVKRAVVESGAWADGDAVGRLIVTEPSGTFTSGIAAGGGVVTLTGDATAITLLAAGARVETDAWNFGPGARLYGIDGANRGFEFDGEVLVPLATGASPDVPTRVSVLSDCLVLAYGENIQYSGIGTPYRWNVVDGAGEIAIGATINVMVRQSGDQSSQALSVHTETSTDVFYGVPGSATFQRIPYLEATGAKPYTGQRLSQAFVLDDSGVMSLVASQNYGNFDAASLTLRISRFVQTRRNLAVGSVVARRKSQYRLFFSDGYGLFITVANGKLLGCMPVQFPHVVSCAWHGTAADGSERMFIGATNGMVYQLDVGTSFDGDDIDWFMAMMWAGQTGHTIRKRYRRALIELQATGYAAMTISHDLSYRSEDIPRSRRTAREVLDAGGLVWDVGAWDTGLIWGGAAVSTIRVPLDGTGENISLQITGQSDKVSAHTLNSVTYHYTPRRLSR